MTDGGAVIEVLDDVVNILGEAVDVVAEIFFEQRVVFLIDLAQRPVRLVGKRRLLGIELQFLDQLGEFLLGELGPFGQHLGASFLPPFDQDALQAADDDDRQDDILVFISLELAAQPLGRLPDLTGKVVKFLFIKRKCHDDRTCREKTFLANSTPFAADRARSNPGLCPTRVWRCDATKQQGDQESLVSLSSMIGGS